MNLARQHLLAGPRLAFDQNGDIAGRNGSQGRLQRQHRRAASKEHALHRRFELLRRGGFAVLQSGVQDPAEFHVIDGLGQEVRGSALDGLDNIERRGEAGERDDRDGGIDLANLAQRFEAVFFRHHDVKHNRLDAGTGTEIRHGLFAIARRDHFVTLATEHDFQALADFAVILGDKNGFAVH